MNRIYLISDTGAAWGSDEGAAKALEAVGYRRCTREEYHRKKRQMREADTAMPESTTPGTISDADLLEVKDGNKRHN